MAARNGNCVIESASLGESWLQALRLIMDRGLDSRYDRVRTKEVANLTLVVATPNPQDAFIQQYGDPEWLAWMHDNFFTQ